MFAPQNQSSVTWPWLKPPAQRTIDLLGLLHRIFLVEFLVNLRINHAYHLCGMLPSHLSKFCSTAGIATRDKDILIPTWKETVHIVRLSSSWPTVACRMLQWSRLGQKKLLAPVLRASAFSQTLATAGRRMPVFQMLFVSIGQRTHKVLCVETATKSDDPCTQRHEMIGCPAFLPVF